MLKKFKVRGFRNFQEEIILDLTSANYEFNRDCIKGNNIKTALIYGLNSSGKTNIGLAIFDLIEHLTDNNNEQLKKNYYLNANSSKGYASFEYTFLINQKEIIYKYTKNENHIVDNEKLFIDDEQIVEYQLKKSLSVNLKGTESLNKNINPELNLSALKYIHSNANLDLRNRNSKTFNMFINFVDNMLLIRTLVDSVSYIGFKAKGGNIYRSILEQNNLIDFESFLNESGIICKLAETEEQGFPTIGFKFQDKVIPLAHIASTGTKTLTYFYFWWQSAKNNMTSLIFIDEFDASYHFELSRGIIKRLKSLDSQVILTTHNTALLDNDLIRPDCGFIINSKEIVSLHNSTSKELRQAHNIEKMYRAGSFNE